MAEESRSVSLYNTYYHLLSSSVLTLQIIFDFSHIYFQDFIRVFVCFFFHESRIIEVLFFRTLRAFYGHQ